MLAALLHLTTGPDFPPVDEAANDTQFAEFRANVIGSIEKKNYDWVIARISGEIKFSFGESGGKKELLKHWEVSQAAKDEFFAELLACLKLGGQFKKYDNKRYFVAPYVFSAWPDGYDAFEHVAVLPEATNVFAAANAESEIVSEIGHTIIRVDYGAGTDEWQRVMYEDDKWGWVPEKDLRSPLERRALFVKNEVGSYSLVTFVAGD